MTVSHISVILMFSDLSIVCQMYICASVFVSFKTIQYSKDGMVEKLLVSSVQNFFGIENPLNIKKVMSKYV